ncbi:hypothetical protein SAMN02745857_04129 [Andreprevotia lacus DSM 23236]|jgi:hypothetical protein|uniref:SH3 domain-containing protein n=1 Tax=Andreprevotia lacus DSM 23236 TaxID=1121001 RepID=A0A1W1Y204_9NEIS|nr:hypothetical protein [Andreprevotia lacus]SMC29788.1 hypothetical protein SAMN02745857_04129 [Andreprevotia lacus DSM 23236]
MNPNMHSVPRQWRLACCGGLLALALGALAHAESGTLIRAADLKQKPFLDAASAGQLPANATLDILNRQGAWMQVKSGASSGWVKLLNVRTGSGKTNSGNAVGALANVVTTGSSGTTVTTGVKGVSRENLEKSEPNFKEVDKLTGMAVSAPDAARAAQQAKLAALQVPEIDLPRGLSSGSSNSNSGGENSTDNLRKRR